MSTQPKLFEEQQVSDKFLKVFDICNRAGKSFQYNYDFYSIKNVILKDRGVKCGYDLQQITKECWSCEGAGWYSEGNVCYKCNGGGIYGVVHVVLERYALNGKLYHIPLGRYGEISSIDGQSIYGMTFENTIRGYIKHDTPKENPVYAYAQLLYMYDKDKFLRFLVSLYNRSTNKMRRKYKMLVSRASDRVRALGVWLGVTKEEIEDIDELPF